MRYSLLGKRIWVAGHRGMVGSALVRALKARSDVEILTVDRGVLDLTDQAGVRRWMEINRPHAVMLAAARVGGIHANCTQPVDFLYENLVIETNIIHAAHLVDVEKLLFLGSSCIYPKFAPQPIREESLLAGSLEPTNEWYAIAKIAGIKLGQAYRRQYGRDFISAMPTNLYGPNDNFDLTSSHVLPALIRKIHTAATTGDASVVLWGTGKPRREFMHVDDLASACLFLLEHYSDESHINIGSGSDLEIGELAELIAGVIGWKGDFVYDQSKPDGMARKLLDGSRLSALGWKPKISLEDGLHSTYQWYLANFSAAMAKVRH